MSSCKLNDGIAIISRLDASAGICLELVPSHNPFAYFEGFLGNFALDLYTRVQASGAIHSILYPTKESSELTSSDIFTKHHSRSRKSTLFHQ